MRSTDPIYGIACHIPSTRIRQAIRRMLVNGHPNLPTCGHRKLPTLGDQLTASVAAWTSPDLSLSLSR